MKLGTTLAAAVAMAAVVGTSVGHSVASNERTSTPIETRVESGAAALAADPILVVQWRHEDGGNDHWYGVIAQELYWFEADSLATTFVRDSMPGYLATVTSAEENAFIIDSVIRTAHQPSITDLYWLGGRELDGVWYWMNSEPFGYTNWLPGEPNNPGIETALCMWGPYSQTYGGIPGLWNDALPDDAVNDYHRWWSVIEWGTPDSTLPPAVCGNGILEPGEECDDGNLEAGDGCDPWCAVEPIPDDTVIHLIQWPTDEGGNDHWYAVLTGERYWVEAHQRVSELEHEGMTGYLATVTSPAENAFILNQVIAGTNQPSVLDMFWLGGMDIGAHWVWVTNEPFQYFNWSTGEPNNVGIETALGMWGPNQTDPRRTPGQWNNSLIDASVNPLARFWTLVEWGEPDTTLPDPVCGNGILEYGEECDDGNLEAGDGCDPWCQFEPPPPDDTLLNLVQWPSAQGGNDHWYAVLTGEKYWYEANARAAEMVHEEMPGYLATVTSPAENDFILNEVIAGANQTSVLDLFWLGGRDIHGWLWTTYEPFLYTNWSTGEPNNIGIETALGMWGHHQSDPRRIPGKWNNALPDPTVNPYSRFWALVEWGEPDTTLPLPVCGNGILEPGEECDDGNLDAGDGCDPWCEYEPGAGITFHVDTDTGNGTLYAGKRGSIIFSVVAPVDQPIVAFSMPLVYHFSNGNIIGAIDYVGGGTPAEVMFSAKSWSAFEVLAWNEPYGYDVTDPDTTLLGCIDFGGSVWSGSGEIWRLTFTPRDTGTITIDSITVPPGTTFEVIDPDAQSLPFTWAPVTITVVEGLPTGDVNGTDVINSSDVIFLVNYLFRSGPAPAPCEAGGDVNCSGSITTGDVITLVNFIFKGGSAPCNAADLVLAGVWLCP